MLSTYKTVLSKKSQLNSNTYLFHFDLIDPKEIVFKAGQYVILKVPTNTGELSRLYSIASPDTAKNSFDLIIEMIPNGLASNYLLSIKENVEVVFQGPAGMFSIKENEKDKIFLVTGTGIAPVLSMFKSRPQSHKFHLFWGLKNYQQVYLFDDLKKFNNFKICLSRESSLDIIPESDKKYFDLGHVDNCFTKQFGNLTIEQFINFEFYLCGGRLIVEDLKQTLSNKSVPQENIIFEKF